jgi:hypothetical protein
MKAIVTIVINAIPILLMIGLIPFVRNDVWLSGIYILIIVAALLVKREKNDLAVLAFGFIGLTVSELFFISTGVETFNRQSLFGVMPFWLPILWAYAFVVIKRGVEAIG